LSVRVIKAFRDDNFNTYADAFAIKAQEHNRSSSALAADKLLALRPHSSTSSGLEESEAPPRLLSDQMVNIFLQEWLPLFPVLHRPTFLALYEKYVSNEADIKDKGSLAMLNLVFGIATLSSEVGLENRSLYKVVTNFIPASLFIRYLLV